MKKILYVTCLLAVFTVSAQNRDLKNVSDNERATAAFIEKVRIRNAAMEASIEAYLKTHPSEQRRKVSNNTVYEIIEVINGKPVYRATDNAAAALATGTSTLNTGGSLGLSLDGEGLTVGVWDDGYVLKTHVEFTTADGTGSRLTYGDIPNPNGNPTSQLHATHVAGTIAAKGVNPEAKGMAPKANIRSYNWSNDDVEVLQRAVTAANQPEDGFLLFSNHSYGIPVFDDENELNLSDWEMGCYTSWAAVWDELANLRPYYLTVASAGNSGLQSYEGAIAPGYDKLTRDKVAKNTLVIANANPVANFLGQLTSLTINGSSSQGPADDGRIKPDIAGDGTQVLSTSNDLNNQSYVIQNGTSMASPNVAGSLLLLQEHYHNLNNTWMLGATVKGLVCHTATDDNQRIGPDPKFGWGFLNTKASAELITKAKNNQALIFEGTLANNQTYTTTINVINPEGLKATICWSDVPGEDQSGQLNSLVPALVNDLDLRLEKDEVISYPWKLDPANFTAPAIKGDNLVDNVEVVQVDNSSAGQYTLTISHKGTLSGGSQNFSLIVSTASMTLSSDKFEANEVTVWPNPAKDVLNISFDTQFNNVKASLVDMAGRVVYASENGAISGRSFSINTSNFAKGIYMLNLNSDGKVLSKKVIIE